MRATDLIEELERLVEEYGDLEVEVRNGAGDYNPVDAVDVSLCGPTSVRAHVVLLDC